MVSNPSFDSRGLAIGSVRGVRAWKITSEGRLRGVFYDYDWDVGVNEALCLKKTDIIYGFYPGSFSQGMITSVTSPEHVPPSKQPHSMDTCHCGFYGYYDGSNDYYGNAQYGKGPVTGVVEGFGDVLIGSRGFRVQKARIVALMVDEGLAGRVFESNQRGTEPPSIEESRLAVARMVDYYSGIPLFTKFEDMIAEFPEEDGGARDG